MKRFLISVLNPFQKIGRLLIITIVSVIKWFINILAFPFKEVRKASTINMVLLLFAGIIFMVSAYFLYNMHPETKDFLYYFAISAGGLGLLFLIFGLVGAIK